MTNIENPSLTKVDLFGNKENIAIFNYINAI